MIFLKKKLYQHYLPKLIENKCDASIPRSGENGKKVNCFVVLFFNGDDPYLLVEDFIKDKLICLQWDGNSFKQHTSIYLEATDSLSLKIEHYYGFDNVSYSSIYDYVIHQITHYIYLKIHLSRAKEFLSQYLFNKRSLATKKRFDFLKLLIDKFHGKNDGFSYVSVMAEMHTNRSFLHPEFDQEAKKIEAHLKGFVDTGELKLINHQYYLTGFAFQAIDTYEEQDRRHKSAIRAQYLIIALTLVLAILTAVQAGVIVLPTYNL